VVDVYDLGLYFSFKMPPKKKGGKRSKKAMDLGEFLNSTGDPSPGMVTKIHYMADDGDDVAPKQVVLPTAPRSARGPTIDPSTISDHPPFIARVGNLPFQMADHDLEMFFSGLSILETKLEEDPMNPAKMLGYGTIEFASKVDLLEALEKHEDTMRGRKIRVEVPGSSDHGGRGDRYRDRGPRDENQGERSNECADWRSARPDPAPPRGGGFEDRSGGGGFGDRRGGFGDRDRRDNDDFDRFADRGDRDRGRDNDNFDRFADRGDRDRGRDNDNFDRFADRGDRSSRGGFGDRRDGGGFDRDRRDGGGFDRDRRDGGGYDRDRRDGGFGGRRGGFEEDERSSWRREAPATPAREEPQERQKLQLAPRTKPLPAEGEKVADKAEPGEEPKRSASIFGDAKPVDIAAKEKEKVKPKKETPAVVKPKNEDLFGAAKPVDTLAREKEIEEKLAKKKLEEASSKRKEEPKQVDSWRDRDRDDRDRKSVWDRRDDRGPRRDGDRDRDERSYDRRDNRDYDRRDNRDYDRRDNRDYDRRDNRDYDRRDNRDYDRKDNRDYDRRDDRDLDRRDRPRYEDERPSSRNENDRTDNNNKKQGDEKKKPAKEKKAKEEPLNDEERFKKAQPKKKGNKAALDVKSYSTIDLEEELA